MLSLNNLDITELESVSSLQSIKDADDGRGEVDDEEDDAKEEEDEDDDDGRESGGGGDKEEDGRGGEIASKTFSLIPALTSSPLTLLELLHFITFLACSVQRFKKLDISESADAAHTRCLLCQCFKIDLTCAVVHR